MRFSETLRFNANPDWWSHYLPYDDLKDDINLIKKLQNAIQTSSQFPSPQQDTETSSQPDESTDDEAEESQDQYATPPQRVALEHKTLHRTASQRVLADLDRTSSTRYAPGYRGVLFGRGSSQQLHTAVSQLPGQSYFRKLDELENRFLQDLRRHSTNIDNFYKEMVKELEKDTMQIESEADDMLRRMGRMQQSDSYRENSPLLSSDIDPEAQTYFQPPSQAEVEFFKTKMVKHYKELGETTNFASLNRNAFRKITKKHDKSSDIPLQDNFMKELETTASFTDTTPIVSLQRKTEQSYHHIFKPTDGEEAAKSELQEELRDLIIWDRNTIWRDILRRERKVSAIRSVRGGQDFELGENSEVELKVKVRPTIAAIMAFLIILLLPQIVRSLPVKGGPEFSDSTLNAAHRCLAMAIAAIILWATDGIPLFITSITVIPTSILLHVFLGKDGEPLSTAKAAAIVFEKMSSQTIILIVCVYSLGAALTKFQIDRLVATNILSRVRREDHLLAAAMVLAVVVSMFISNVAAPVLLISVMMPTIDAMSGSEHNRKYIRCLLIGIMVASNVGGFASTIASPQSLVAIGLLTGDNKISFLKWLIVALPQIFVMLIAFFALLVFQFRIGGNPLPRLPRSPVILEWPHIVIFMSIIITVLLWTFHDVCEQLGGDGVVAMIPIISLFGTGILTKEDFNNLPWDVVYLVAGGSVLGAAVESCRLLDLIANRLTDWIGDSNVRSAYYLFCIFMAFVANFVSHTVTAIIVLPLVYKVGMTLEHPQLLVLGGTFAASCAMGLAISSFPNISVTKVEDEKGEPYVTASQVLKYGSQMTGVATIVLLFFGGEYMLALGL